MTTRSVEPGMSHIDKPGVDPAAIPALGREADARARKFPAGLKHGAHGHPIVWMRVAKPVSTIEAERGASALAIVSEIKASAMIFAETCETASIDLRCLKAMPEEREILASMLGEGEVSVVVDTAGRTEIRETSVPCVWWIRHCDAQGETVGELIEVTCIPDLIEGDRKAVVRGLEFLNAALQLHASGAVDHPNSNAR